MRHNGRAPYIQSYVIFWIQRFPKRDLMEFARQTVIAIQYDESLQALRRVYTRWPKPISFSLPSFTCSVRKIQQICKCSEWIPGYVAHSENPKEEAMTTEATFVLGGIDLTSKLFICGSRYANAQS